MIWSIARRIPASTSSFTLHSQGIVSATIRTVGIPLFDAADRPSVTKPSFASATAGRCKSSTDIASCTRNLVHEPQSATESTTASTLATQATNFALPSVSISGVLIVVHAYHEDCALRSEEHTSELQSLRHLV